MMPLTSLKIHPLTLLFLTLAFFTGYFQYVFSFLSLIFIHELGHTTAALIYGWKVKNIVILPFGGMTTFEEAVNRPMIEELVITLSGPIYQMLFYVLLKQLGFATPLLKEIHLSLLIFNLLPMIPLDGSKIFHLFLQLFQSYYDSFFSLVIVSFLTLFFFFFFHLSLLTFLLMIYLAIQLFLFNRSISSTFMKFLLERWMYVFSFHKKKIITHPKQMKRDYHHVFLKKGECMLEKEYLDAFFSGKPM